LSLITTGQDVLTEVLREGARRMLAWAIEAEVATWIDDHAHLRRSEDGNLPQAKLSCRMTRRSRSVILSPRAGLQ
jgi:hypothetical protein